MIVGFGLLVLVFAVLVALAINPKWGALLVWPIIFLYPHLYMARLDLLPWNIGVDDIFVCVFFLIVLVRRNLLGGVPFRLGLSVAGVTIYFLIWTVANLSGWTMMPELEPVDVIKPILKCVIFVLFTYAMVHTIDDERDLRRSASAFIVTMVAASLTVILHKLFPNQMVIFTSERVARFQQMEGAVQRAVGSLTNPNTGCAVLAMAVLFMIVRAHVTPSLSRKLALACCMIIILAAMVLTGSRTGTISLAIVLGIIGLVSRARLYAWLIIVAMVGVVLIQPSLLFDLWERIIGTYSPEAGGQLGSSTQTRIDTWVRYWQTATAQVWLLGQGRLVPTVNVGFHSHSTYVGALFIHGMAGVIWLFWFFGTTVRRGLLLVRTRLEPYQSLAAAVLWGLLAWAIAGITLDLLVTFNPRFVFLFFVVLIERSYALATQRWPVVVQVPAGPAARGWPQRRPVTGSIR